MIISAGYRIGPFEVESALVAHAAVAEAAVVAAPDDERGSVVRAVVVLRDGYAPSDALASELQDHVKAQTAPYKYPRIVDFAADLPKTASGKVRRAELRERARGRVRGRRRLLPAAADTPSAAATIASISTCAPSGSAATPIVARAGGSSGKNVAVGLVDLREISACR